MIIWKQKSSWLAVAGTSLMLTACGGDSSSSSGAPGGPSLGGPSLEPLTYTGLETPAAITADNYKAIAQEAHTVVLAMLAGEKLEDSGDFPGFGPGMAPMMMSEAVVDIQRSTLSAMNADSEIRAAMAAPVGGEYNTTATVDGSCGGTATAKLRMSKRTAESIDPGTELTISEEQFQMETTLSFRNFCNTLDDNETEVVLNGSLSRSDSDTEKEDEIARTRSDGRRYSASSKLTATIAGNSYTVETAVRNRYQSDEVNTSTPQRQYNPDTFVDEISEVVVISGAGVSAQYTNNNVCEVDAEDLSSLNCTTSKVLKSGNSNYKLEGSIDNSNINATVYLPDYGWVTISSSYRNIPSACESYDALSNGDLIINGGDTLINYKGCSDQPVVTYHGVGDLMKR